MTWVKRENHKIFLRANLIESYMNIVKCERERVYSVCECVYVWERERECSKNLTELKKIAS